MSAQLLAPLIATWNDHAMSFCFFGPARIKSSCCGKLWGNFVAFKPYLHFVWWDIPLQWWMFWWGFPLFSLVCTQLTFKWRHAQGRGNKTSLLSLARPRSFSPLSFGLRAPVPYKPTSIPPFLAFSSRQCQRRVAISRQGKLLCLDIELSPLFSTHDSLFPRTVQSIVC